MIVFKKVPIFMEMVISDLEAIGGNSAMVREEKAKKEKREGEELVNRYIDECITK